MTDRTSVTEKPDSVWGKILSEHGCLGRLTQEDQGPSPGFSSLLAVSPRGPFDPWHLPVPSLLSPGHGPAVASQGHQGWSAECPAPSLQPPRAPTRNMQILALI